MIRRIQRWADSSPNVGAWLFAIAVAEVGLTAVCIVAVLTR